MAKKKDKSKSDKSDKDKWEKKEDRKTSHGDEIKRLNRISGQIEGIKKMLADGRALDDILVQCRAVHSALKSIESRLLEAHVEVCINEIATSDKKKNKEGKTRELAELFRHVA